MLASISHLNGSSVSKTFEYPIHHFMSNICQHFWHTASAPNTSFLWRMKCESVSSSVGSDFLWPHGLQSSCFLCPWDSPGKDTGVGRQSLLQGIFLNPGMEQGLLHCRQILYHLSHQRSPWRMGTHLRICLTWECPILTRNFSSLI